MLVIRQLGFLALGLLGTCQIACEPDPDSIGLPIAFATGGSGSGGTTNVGFYPSTGGTTSTTGGSDYFVSTDYGLMGEGGAPGNGLGEGDLTVLLLIDRSSSMAEGWDSGSKWEVSLNAFFLGLVGVEDQVTLGALFFPTDGECGVASMTAPEQFKYQSGRNFVSSWKAKSSSIFPEGSTPLGPAFEQAHDALQKAYDAGLMNEGRRFRVVVVTDGLPNCATDQNRVLSLANVWRGWGVEVRVIGLPGSEEAATFLTQLATPNIPNPDQGGEVFTPDSGEDAEDEFYGIIR